MRQTSGWLEFEVTAEDIERARREWGQVQQLHCPVAQALGRETSGEVSVGNWTCRAERWLGTFPREMKRYIMDWDTFRYARPARFRLLWEVTE